MGEGPSLLSHRVSVNHPGKSPRETHEMILYVPETNQVGQITYRSTLAASNSSRMTWTNQTYQSNKQPQQPEQPYQPERLKQSQQPNISSCLLC